VPLPWQANVTRIAAHLNKDRVELLREFESGEFDWDEFMALSDQIYGDGQTL
jgi:hypothetical protein